MDKITTYFEAWDDFFNWIREQPKWKEMTRQEQQYIYQANMAREKERSIEKRIETILTKYGGDRYEFQGRVIIHDE